MGRRVISIVFYVVAGFFVYMVNLLAFVNLGAPIANCQPPAWAKAAILAGFSVPAVIALVAGLAISRFQHWRRDIGIVAVSGAGMTTLVVLMVVCILLSPDSKEFFPREKLDFFSDYGTGAGAIIVLTLVGVMLIKISRREGPNQAAPPAATR